MNPANEPAPAVHRTAGNGQQPACATAKYERLPLISLERAVALGEGWSYAAPTLSGVGALALIVGIPDPVGPFLIITLGSLSLIASFGTVALLGPLVSRREWGRGLFAFMLMMHTISRRCIRRFAPGVWSSARNPGFSGRLCWARSRSWRSKFISEECPA